MAAIIFRAAKEAELRFKPDLCAPKPTLPAGYSMSPCDGFSLPASHCTKLGWPQVWSLYGAGIGQQKQVAEKLSGEREVTAVPPPLCPQALLGLVSLPSLPPEPNASFLI